MVLLLSRVPVGSPNRRGRRREAAWIHNFRRPCEPGRRAGPAASRRAGHGASVMMSRPGFCRRATEPRRLRTESESDWRVVGRGRMHLSRRSGCASAAAAALRLTHRSRGSTCSSPIRRGRRHDRHIPLPTARAACIGRRGGGGATRVTAADSRASRRAGVPVRCLAHGHATAPSAVANSPSISAPAAAPRRQGPPADPPHWRTRRGNRGVVGDADAQRSTSRDTSETRAGSKWRELMVNTSAGQPHPYPRRRTPGDRRPRLARPSPRRGPLSEGVN